MEKTIKKIVNSLIEDLSDRSGIGNEWEAIDKETQAELKSTWESIIIKGLSKHAKSGESMNFNGKVYVPQVLVDGDGKICK